MENNTNNEHEIFIFSEYGHTRYRDSLRKIEQIASCEKVSR